MLSFRALSEKKTKVKINPKQAEITEMEKNHGEDCDCMKCERKRRKGEKEPEVATESAVPGKPAERLGAVTAIPQSERDAAAERLKAKAAAKRAEREKLKDSKGMKEGYYDPMEDPDFDHDEAERTRGQSGKPAKKKTKKSTKKEDVAYVSQEEVSEESNQEIAETETFLTFGQFHEGRAEDAKASLEKVKARQKVLDAHEKKTGKKLDITKTPEHKAHKQNFPGAKRTGKKVPGAKETPLETHNRRVNKSNERIVKKGYTSKEKKEVQSMAKHASRYD